MPRYVVLRHECPPTYGRDSHWDLMLESDGTLQTWAMPTLPAIGQEILVEQLAAHRIAYLDYEGPISNDRGSVRQWTSGTFYVKRDEVTRKTFQIESGKLAGTLTLRRDENTSAAWRLIWTA